MLLIQGSRKGRNSAFDFWFLFDSFLKRALTAHAVVVFSYCVRLTAPGCNFAFAEPTDVSSFLSTGKYSAKSHLSTEYDGATSEHLVVIFPAGDSNQLKRWVCARCAGQDWNQTKIPVRALEIETPEGESDWVSCRLTRKLCAKCNCQRHSVVHCCGALISNCFIKLSRCGLGLWFFFFFFGKWTVKTNCAAEANSYASSAVDTYFHTLAAKIMSILIEICCPQTYIPT